MTNPVKFPYSDESEAPDYIYVNPICWQNPYYGASPLFNGLKYHRADTVTPNDLVDELLAAAKSARLSIAADEHRKRLFKAIAKIEKHKAA